MKKVLDKKELIERARFGFNGGELDCTCSAVALSLGLWYLDQTSCPGLVPAEFALSSKQGADAFHRFLVEMCRMHPRRLFGKPIGVWAWMVTQGYRRYVKYLKSKSDLVPPRLTWRLRADKSICKCIDSELPALITTTLSNFEHGRFNGHTMLVYGYRRESDTLEFLVHPGWHGNPRGVWVPARIATLMYLFE